MTKWMRAAAVVMALVLALAVFTEISLAQDERPGTGNGQPGEMRRGGGDDGPGGGRPRGQWGRGDFDPERMRQMMEQRMKESLKCTDEEWEVIGPMLQKVQQLQFQMRAGAFGGFGGRRGGPGGPGGPGRGPSMENPEADALREAVESESSSSDSIKAKLEAYRAAQKKKEAELAKAQDELRQVLTVRQEAALVLRGVLD